MLQLIVRIMGRCVYVGFFVYLKEKNKPEYLKNAATKLKEVSAFLGSHQYFAGDHVNHRLIFLPVSLLLKFPFVL